MNSDPKSELDALSVDPAWIAFRYVAGELPADEARAFEARLADDQTARDALSRATALALCLAEAASPDRAAFRNDGGSVPSESGSNAQFPDPRESTVELSRPGSFASRTDRFVYAAVWSIIGASATVAVWFAVELPHRRTGDGGTPAGPVAASPFAPAGAAAWLEVRELDANEFESAGFDLSDPGQGRFESDLSTPVVPAWVVDLAKAPKEKP